MVKVRGRNSNGKTVKQTVKNGRKISGDDAARLAWVTGTRRQQFAAASRFWSTPNLMPRLTVTGVWLTEWAHLGQLCGTLTSDNLFFCFCRFVSVVWQDSDRVQSVTQGTWYSGRSSMLSSDSWLIDIGEPDASQFVVPARLPKPVIGWTVRVVFLLRGLTTMCQKSTAHEQRRSRGESRKLRFGSNHTAPKIWQEGQHDLHSPPQPIDWQEHTIAIGAVHDRNLPTRSLQHVQVPESYENFLWHRVKVRSIVTGLRHDDERDDDRSHRRVSNMSSLDAGWSGWSRISWFSRVTMPWMTWLRGGTSVAPRRHKCSHVPDFPPSVWPSSRSNFDLGPSPLDSTEKTLSYQSLWFWSAVFL